MNTWKIERTLEWTNKYRSNDRMNERKIEWIIELTLEWTKEKEQMIEWIRIKQII